MSTLLIVLIKHAVDLDITSNMSSKKSNLKFEDFVNVQIFFMLHQSIQIARISKKKIYIYPIKHVLYECGTFLTNVTVTIT